MRLSWQARLILEFVHFAFFRFVYHALTTMVRGLGGCGLGGCALTTMVRGLGGWQIVRLGRRGAALCRADGAVTFELDTLNFEDLSALIKQPMGLGRRSSSARN